MKTGFKQEESEWTLYTVFYIKWIVVSSPLIYTYMYILAP